MDHQLLKDIVAKLVAGCGVGDLDVGNITRQFAVILRTENYLTGYSGPVTLEPNDFFWATEPPAGGGDRKDKTPGVKISQNLTDDMPDFDLWLNYVPTEFDIGMAWRARIRSIIYPVITGAEGGTVAAGRVQNAIANCTAAVRVDPGENVYGHFQRISFDGDGSIIQARFTTGIGDPPGGSKKERVSLAAAAEAKLGDAGEAPDLTMPDLAPASPPKVEAQGFPDDGFDGQLTAPAKDMTQYGCDSVFMLTAYALVGGAWQAPVAKASRSVEAPRPYGNNIGGLLVEETGDHELELIGWGLNFKGLNPTFHGETLMIQEYLGSDVGDDHVKLPDNSSLYTTLEPCYMCSGYITTVGSGIRVISGQDDPNISAPDKRPSALRSGKNGCRLENWQANANYPVAAFLESMMQQAVREADKNPDDTSAQRNIIDFLFGEGAEAAYTDELSVLPLFIQRKMELFADDATRHYASRLADKLKTSDQLKTPREDLVKKLWPRADGIAGQIYAALLYCNKFLDELSKRKVVNSLASTKARLATTTREDPIWKQIPFV